MKFSKFCRAGGKWAYEEYLQKHLPTLIFLFDVSLPNVKISRAFSAKELDKTMGFENCDMYNIR